MYDVANSNTLPGRRATRAITLAALIGLGFAGSACSPQVTAGDKIFHTVRMDLRDDADPAEVKRVLGMMRDLGSKLDVVESYVVVNDLADDFDVSATYVLNGYDGYRTYLFDPLHLEIDKAGLPLVENMVSFDVIDTPDAADARRKIAQSMPTASSKFLACASC